MKIEYWKMLTHKEQKKVTDYSAKIRWGFNAKTIRRQFKRYMNGSLKTKAKVCYLLSDCNYHTLCGYLADGDMEAAEAWIEKEFPLPKPKKSNKTEVEAYILEGSKGKFLHINSTEDGNGTWFDWTSSIWEAYWVRKQSDLKVIADTEFSDFAEGYPKFHKVRYTAEMLGTVEG